MVQAGNEWLKGVAQEMKDASDNGAAPTPKKLAVRELVERFGGRKRGDWINSEIRNALERHGLSTNQDIAVGWFQSPITIRLDSSPPPVGVSSDPTNRIGSLAAAKRVPTRVAPTDPISAATTLMQVHDYSQLPAMINDRDVAGVVTWKSIGARLALGVKCEFVSQCMEPEIVLPNTARLFEGIAPIAEHGYVLIRAVDRRIVGIVTASDISLQFMQLAGPFLFVGEIEGHLRNLIRGKFILKELQAASISEDGRRIEGPGDLTLGGFHQLLGNRENWNRLGLGINRKVFVEHLKDARNIRNKVMHFTLGGVSEDERQKLRGIARFFENLVRMGAM